MTNRIYRIWTIVMRVLIILLLLMKILRDNKKLQERLITRFKCLDGSGRKSFSYRLDDLLEKKVRYNTTAWDADAKSLEDVWENNCRLCR
jgi:predicted PurR-regulated permease PerM